MAEVEPNYNASFYSNLFNITERRIQQLAATGVIPKAARGKYPLIGTIRGYVTYLQERSLGEGVIRIDYQAEKAGLVKAQREKAQLEVEELKGELTRNVDVVNEWAKLIMAFRARLLALPSAIVTVIDTADDLAAREALARDLVEAALNELAGTGLSGVDQQNNHSYEAASKATAEVKG